jgi:hypothetical protein
MRFDRAREALDKGEYEEAARGFEAVVAEVDGWPDAWFNLGLAYKFLRDWPNSARCNARAAELRPDYEEAWWNGGVAATALRDWTMARRCWRGIGIEPDDRDGPPEMNLGSSPVRLWTADGGRETIWGTRIDPCRLRIDSVPLANSGHRWGDVILHDVVPNGTRFRRGRTWSVFDELIRMDASPHPTLRCDVTVPTDDDWENLHERFLDAGLGAEDWSSVNLICKQCDESSVHTHATVTDAAPIRLVVRPFGFGGPASSVERVLGEWAAAGDGRAFGPLDDAETSQPPGPPDGGWVH